MKASWQHYCPASLSQLIFKANRKQMNLGAESSEHPGLCCSPEMGGKGSTSLLLLAGTGCSHWRGFSTHKTRFWFVLWLRNQSIDSWQQSSPFLQSVIPLPVLSVLQRQPGRYKFKYLIELNIESISTPTSSLLCSISPLLYFSILILPLPTPPLVVSLPAAPGLHYFYPLSHSVAAFLSLLSTTQECAMFSITH